MSTNIAYQVSTLQKIAKALNVDITLNDIV